MVAGWLRHHALGGGAHVHSSALTDSRNPKQVLSELRRTYGALKDSTTPSSTSMIAFKTQVEDLERRAAASRP